MTRDLHREATPEPVTVSASGPRVVQLARCAHIARSSTAGGKGRVRVRALTVLRMPHAQRDAVVGWLERNLPYEAGGILYALNSGGRRVAQLQPVAFDPLPSALPSLTRYRARADALVSGVLHFAAQGAHVIATVHSHPHASPRPSPTDILNAYGYRQVVHVIVGFDTGLAMIRAYRFAAPNSHRKRLYCWQVPLYITD
ncbi:MAG: Mov34/MPN/PAD-1 family protein [Firmicutes bacterium]|nr:Mov34/MPN/PAD-1 family protein [Bacillota bacterium]